MRNQQLLFQYNILGNPSDKASLTFEWKWIEELKSRLDKKNGPVNSYAELQKAIERLARPVSSGASLFLADEINREQFKRVISEYAPDGLTEAFAMFSAIPKVQGAAQFPVMRILIDEFGKGKLQKSHSELYRELLRELGLPTELEGYGKGLNEESFAFVNIYHWLTKRADKIDYYLGALAFSEMIVPSSFQTFAAACERLGIQRKDYFTEHIHIDSYHTKEAFHALEILAKDNKIDLNSALLGAELVKEVGDLAFEAAMRKAMQEKAA